jgi:hypothetical protein
MPPLPQTWDISLVSTSKGATRATVVFDVLRFGTVVARCTMAFDDSAPRPPNAVSYSFDVTPV